MQATTTYGPPEIRIVWDIDDEPYDWGDIEPTEDDWATLENLGVLGCTIEMRRPACGCCGRTQWEHAASLWSIVGDGHYHRTIERDLMQEVSI